MQASSTIAYAIKLGDVGVLFTRALSKLADETGGMHIRRIESGLRTRCVLGFRPDPSAAREGMHQLREALVSRREIKRRALG